MQWHIKFMVLVGNNEDVFWCVKRVQLASLLSVVPVHQSSSSMPGVSPRTKILARWFWVCLFCISYTYHMLQHGAYDLSWALVAFGMNSWFLSFDLMFIHLNHFNFLHGVARNQNENMSRESKHTGLMQTMAKTRPVPVSICRSRVLR